MRTTAVLLIACLVCFVTSDFAADHEAALPENGFTEDATELIAIKAASRTLKNIVALKAYSVAARPKVQQLKLTTSASHSGNAILWDFVLEFGKRAPKPVKPAVVPLSQFGFGFATKKTKKSSMKSNIVMQYSQAMGKLKGKYGKGLGRYLLNHLDKAVMSSKNGAVVFYSGRTSAYAQSRPVMMFSYKALALTHMPKYLLKMAVRLSKFSIIQLDVAKASKNAAAKASAMWLHTGKNKHYRDFISKTITKYRKVERANAEKVFKAALHGARKAFKKNSKHVHPMVPGARAGANAAATKSSFKFPSTKKIKAEARAAADKWAKKMKNIKPSGLVKYLEKKAQAAEKKATKKKATKKKATKKKATKKKATKKKATKKKATKKKATKKKVTGLWPISKSCTWCNQGKWHYGIATQQACQHKAIAAKARHYTYKPKQKTCRIDANSQGCKSHGKGGKGYANCDGNVHTQPGHSGMAKATKKKATKKKATKKKATKKAGCKLERNIDYRGSDIKNGQIKHVASSTKCANLCAANKKCKSFTWGRAKGKWYTNMCFLKHHRSGKRVKMNGVDSGAPCKAKKKATKKKVTKKKATKKSGNCSTLHGGGWVNVRHIGAGNHWYPATDQLRGTDVYGRKGSHSWSINFNSAVPGYNEFLFATGDCKKWLVAKKSSVTGGWYANRHRTIQASSTNSKPYSARWYRRSGNKEDPWISLTDHHPAIGQGNIIYGENNFGHGHAVNVLPKHKGADVYIRKK